MVVAAPKHRRMKEGVVLALGWERSGGGHRRFGAVSLGTVYAARVRIEPIGLEGHHAADSGLVGAFEDRAKPAVGAVGQRCGQPGAIKGRGTTPSVGV